MKEKKKTKQQHEMQDKDKTKEQLIRELTEMRLRITESEASVLLHEQMEKRLKESEEKYRNLVSNANDAIFVADIETGIILDANKKAEELIGRPLAEIVGMHQMELHPEEEAERYKNLFKDNILKGKGTTEDLYVCHKSGRRTPVVISSSVMELAGKKIIQGIFRDITEHKRAEEERQTLIRRIEETLREAEAKYRQLFEGETDAVMTFDAATRKFEDVNQATLDLLGYSREEFLALRVEDISAEKDKTQVAVKKIIRNAPDSKKVPIRYLRKKDGSSFPGEISAGSFISRGRKKIIGAVRDISDRKKAEDELREFHGQLQELVELRTAELARSNEQLRLEIAGRERMADALLRSEQRYRRITEAVTDYIYNVQVENGVPVKTSHGSHCVGVTGYTTEEFEANSLLWIAMVPEEDRPSVEKQSSLLLSGKNPEAIEHRIIRKDGTARWVRNESVPYFDSQGNLSSYDGLVRDITKRKRAEEALTESEEKFRSLAEYSPNMIFINQRGKVVYANHTCEDLIGYKKQQFYSDDFDFMSLIAPEHQERVRENFMRHARGEDIEPYEYTLVTKDGRKIESIISTKLIDYEGDNAILGIVTDITERRKLEEEQVKIQKLESLGILAGGIAHNFNNQLAGILGNISLAKMSANPHAEIFDALTEAEKSSLLAKDLTRQLLTFSKGGEPITKIIPIAELIKDSTNFALSGSNVSFKITIARDIWPVEVDESQVSQVFRNIVINADQAMPLGGVINISCKNFLLGKQNGVPLKKGNYVKILIKDRGCGISAEHLSKIFDPYFTTKEKGSGLGLTTAYSIIKKHQGYIEVESKSNKGTTFTIYLPASINKGAKGKFTEKSSMPGSGKILVMDDEETIRKVAGRMLGKLGYDVEYACDGKEAIQIYSKAKKGGVPFQAVIMDLTIPGGMGGKEAVKKLQEIDPNVKAVVSSGYSTDPVMAEADKFGFKGVVTKPYSVEEFSEVLRQVCKAPPSRVQP